MQKYTYGDSTLQAMIQMTRDDRWYESGKCDGQSGIEYDELLIYCSVKEEITVEEFGEMVIRNNKLVTTRNLRQQMFSLAHEIYQGVCKTKSYLRSRVWFHGIDTAVEKEVKQCSP